MRTIGSILCNTKPKNTNDKQKNVIYPIPCECGMVYFGETGQWFVARVQQHQTAVKKFDVKMVLQPMYNKQVTQSDGVKQNVLTNTTTM